MIHGIIAFAGYREDYFVLDDKSYEDYVKLVEETDSDDERLDNHLNLMIIASSIIKAKTEKRKALIIEPRIETSNLIIHDDSRPTVEQTT